MPRPYVRPNDVLNYDWLPAAAAIVGGVATALLAVLAAGRRAARVPPTLALTDAAAEPRLLGPGRIIGGLVALAAAVPLFVVSTGWLAAILGVSALVALVALSAPTRRALRTQPVEAIGIRE